MNDSASIQANFERNKNMKATLITLLICAALFFIFFFLQWTLPQVIPPVPEEGIEVNLGNSETGLGDVAPQIPGEPSAAEETKTSPPPSSQPVAQQQNITADENEAEDVPAIPKPAKIVPKHTNNNEVKPSTKKPLPVTATVPTPAPPKPKALFKAPDGKGTGGNGADSYNGVKNQGIAGGTGDQGQPNGNPNSDSYTGNGGTGKSGVTIRNGLTGRRFTRLPSFEDDFNEPAKVAVDIIVDKNGTVTDASINPRGTTTTNANIRAIALRKAKELKLTPGKDDDDNGTIVFNFKLRG